MICYESRTEILICSSDKEQELLDVYFAESSGRDIKDYDRYIVNGVLQIFPSVRLESNKEIVYQELV